MRVRSVVFPLLLASFIASGLPAQDHAALTSPEERALLHNSPEWASIAAHLPDPKTATAAQLEQAADVLRARRFPEDALDYYGYAIARGGNLSELLNRMGVVRLELNQNDLAHVLFQRIVKVKNNDSQAWNNLGVTEYVDHRYLSAIDDYKKAVKYDKHSAVYHSNLGMAYFEGHQPDSARREFTQAIRIDPMIMQSRENGGVTAHILGSQKYPELCFEMAKLYAQEKDVPSMKLWLAKASEGGYDVQEGIRGDALLAPYLKDADVKLILANAAELRKRAMATVKAPALEPPGAPDGAPKNMN